MKKILVISPITLDGEAGNQQDIKNRLDIFKKLNYQADLIISNNNDWGKIKQAIIDQDPEIIWFEYFKLFKIAKKVKQNWPNKKIYFRAHNYELGHNLEKDLDFFKRGKILMGTKNLILNFIKIGDLERKIFKLADKVFCISQLDLEKYKKRFMETEIVYLPFYNNYQTIHRPKEDKIIKSFYLASNLHNNVNLEGLLNLNSVVDATPNNIEFYITGSKLDPKIKLSQRIKYLGFVEDLEQFLAEMDVALIPVNIGYGMKIKAYECLKRGFPTVLTNRLDKVMGGKDGQDYFVANNKKFIKALEKLTDFKVREEMSKQILEFMTREYSEEKIKKIISENI